MKRIGDRRRANDAPQKPSFDVFLALVNLAAHFNRAWVIVTQEKLLERVKASTGRVMSRRTLNRHLLALERRALINRTSRHRRTRTGKLQLQATLFTFGLKAKLWIKTMQRAGSIPLGRLAVPKMAQSKNPIGSRSKRAVDKSIHSEGRNRGPRDKRGGARRPPRSRT